ncbi:unnamed protein product [Ectocarpus sp. CCAP 1310/34]|nr:unnamed protein product [Ectocarpus sp. CCAP 1310/34]
MDPEEVAQFWQDIGNQWHPETAPRVVWDELLVIANSTSAQLPAATAAAAPGGRIALLSTRGNRAAAPTRDQQPCGKAERCAAAPQFLRVPSLSLHRGGRLCQGSREELGRGGHNEAFTESSESRKCEPQVCESEVMTTRSEKERGISDASFDTSIQMNARGRGVQITRSDCFTEACPAVWVGDEPVPAAIADALLS